jgi:hypothetical protein
MNPSATFFNYFLPQDIAVVGYFTETNLLLKFPVIGCYAEVTRTTYLWWRKKDKMYAIMMLILDERCRV